MNPTQLAVIGVVLLYPVLEGPLYCRALLERIEKHLREQHVRTLGPCLKERLKNWPFAALN